MRNALDRRYRSEVLRKVRNRLRARGTVSEHQAAEAWCRERTQDPTAWAEAIDASAWREAMAFETAQAAYASSINVQSRMGGGAFIALLYFLVRVRRPLRVVETGVAAGNSSRAILSAIKQNGCGRLWSSDLPYMAMDNAEALIGYLVEDELKPNWTLFKEGDRRNLPSIAKAAAPIDLFHYDSDKSVDGRDFAWALLAGSMSPDALVLFDDIQDNLHFANLCRELPAPAHVFSAHGKWIGLIELGEARLGRKSLPR